MLKQNRNSTTILKTLANTQKVTSTLVEKMIEFYILHNLKTTNAFFKHKPIHLTTWQSPVPYVNLIKSKTKT